MIGVDCDNEDAGLGTRIYRHPRQLIDTLVQDVARWTDGPYQDDMAMDQQDVRVGERRGERVSGDALQHGPGLGQTLRGWLLRVREVRDQVEVMQRPFQNVRGEVTPTVRTWSRAHRPAGVG